jgi:hypothetical protein
MLQQPLTIRHCYKTALLVVLLWMAWAIVLLQALVEQTHQEGLKKQAHRKTEIYKASERRYAVSK